jgi:class 3 adenylate cyclase/Tfp pilus assembly protein PilF
LCSVVFMDIVQYSSQSVELQMKWKQRFNGYLAEAIEDVPESERVILDTGDGAAICFLGAPEAAMFAALQLCRSFIVDEREQQPGLRVRLGINLGPVKLVKDINGALNALGDGINAGQRIMSFAAANQILVSQSFFEVVSRLSDDYKSLFRLKGIEADKHVREYTVYHLFPPTSERREPAVSGAEGQGVASIPVRPGGGATGPAEQRSPQRRSILLVAGGAVVVVLAAAGIWYFRVSAGPPTPNVTPTRVNSPDSAPTAGLTKPVPPPPAVSRPDKSASTIHPAETPRVTVVTKNSPALPDQPEFPAPSKSPGSAASRAKPPSREAKLAYDEAFVLLDRHKAAEASRRFDDALRASPDYVDAYIGRAQARRMLVEYELSLKDCNEVIRISPDDPRGYNCRGYGYELLKRSETALRDFNEAIRLNPSFAQAYADRGAAYNDLQQYNRAVQDFSQAIRLRSGNPSFYLKRANVYMSLKQYDKAIEDCSQAIRIQPDDVAAFVSRASAEDAGGYAAQAAADRRHVREARKRE